MSSITWTPLKNQLSNSVSAMWLMQDGRVLAHLYGKKQLYTLTPDNKGSYANGEWSPAGSFHLAKLFFSSAVLSDGRVVACGGEFVGADIGKSNPPQDESNVCEIYDLFNNPTEAVQFSPPKSWANIGDAPSVVLNDGTFMIGNSNPAYNAALLNSSSLHWTVIPGDGYQEETWTLLQTGDVITASCVNQTTQRYSAGANAWGPDQNLPLVLGSVQHTETGPAITLMDGRVICFGATGHTCIYTPGTEGQDGTWAQGPNLPINPVNNEQLLAADVPAMLEPNGKVLLLTQGKKLTQWAWVEYEPVHNKLGKFGPILTGGPSVSGCNLTRMLLLPNGHGLVAVAYSGECYDLTFSHGHDPSWAPTIISFPSNVVTGTTVALKGTQLCGLSECQSFGDDNQQAENYPMVRFVDQHGNVTYARAHDVSTRSIAPGKASVVLVDIPNLASGKYSVYAVAMGIPSQPVTVDVHQIGRPLSQRVGDMDGDGLDEILVSSPWGIGILKQHHIHGQHEDTMTSLAMAASGNDIAGIADGIGAWKLDTAKDDFVLIADFDPGRDEILVTGPRGIAILKYEAGEFKVLASANNGDRLGDWILDTNTNTFGPAADFDGDGASEILVTSSWGLGVLKFANGKIASIHMVANGTNIGGWKLETGSDVFATTADFNQDGVDEVLVTSDWGIGFLSLGTQTAQSGNTLQNGTDLGGWTLNTKEDVFGQVGNYSGGTIADGGINAVEIPVWGPPGMAILANMQVLAKSPNGLLSGGWDLQTSKNLIGPTANYDGDSRDKILVTSSSGVGVLALDRTTDSLSVPPTYEIGTSSMAPNGMVGQWHLDTTFDRLGNVGYYSRNSESQGELGNLEAGVFVTGPHGIAILMLSDWNGPESPVIAENHANIGQWVLDTTKDVF